MSRPLSAQSEQEDSADTILLEEYEKLNNYIRNLQNDKRKKMEETTFKLKKHKMAIEFLNKENIENKCLLALVDSVQNRKHDMKSIEKIKDILKRQDGLHVEIDELKSYGKKLDNEAKKIEKLLKEKEEERVDHIQKETERAELQSQIDKKMLTLTNSLYEKNVKLSETLAKNAELRDFIDRAKNERNIYLSIHKKLSEKSENLNKMKGKLIHNATAAYDQRTDAKNKKHSLKEKNDKDEITYELEIKELQRIIDHNNQLNQFMIKKANERIEFKQEAENRIKKYGSTGEIARKQRDKKIEEYKEAMNKLQQITNKDEIDQMIRYFKRNDDDNFTQFKYVTELNNQIETLNEDIHKKEQEIVDFKNTQKENQKELQAKMHDLEEQTNKDKQLTCDLQKHTQQVQNVLDQVKTQIKNLVVKLGCNLSRISDMLGGDGTEVTERNLLFYLSTLEQRVDELLSVKCFAQTKGQLDEMSQDELKGMLSLNLIDEAKTNREVSVNLPSLIDDEEIIDEEAQMISSILPLTHNELVSKVTKELQRLENKYDSNSNKPSISNFSNSRQSKIRV